ncbi:MAG: thiamine phosphate synthase [Proteobacteria bacterium]|nr:thiamine phosphate synthase [Pseudomonadota bacterium]
MRQSFDLSLYLVIGPDHCAGRDMADVAEAAVRGGAGMVQLRDKASSTRIRIDDARRLAARLTPLGVPLLINDRVDVALAAGADGVHLGQSDMDPTDARRLLGDSAIIGVTVHSLDEALCVPLEQVDYVSIGGVFATASKNNPNPPIDVTGLAEIAVLFELPVVAIAGITRDNAAAVIAAGVGGIAVISAVCAAPDPRAAAADLRAIVDGAKA